MEIDVKGVPFGFENGNLALYERFIPRITVTVAVEFQPIHNAKTAYGLKQRSRVKGAPSGLNQPLPGLEGPSKLTITIAQTTG